MIQQMEKLILYALSEEKKEILDRLMSLKCVQMIPPEQMDGYEELSALAARDVPKTYAYETKLSEISAALAPLAEYEPKAKLFSKKGLLPFESILDLQDLDGALKVAAGVRGIVGNIAEVKSFQSADQFTRQALLPWAAFDVPLDKLTTRGSSTLFFTFPTEAAVSQLQQAASTMACCLEEVSADADLRYVAVTVHNECRDETIQLFKENNGLLISLPAMVGTVADNIAAIDKRNEQNEENQRVLVDSLKAQAQDTGALKQAYDQLSTAIASQKMKHNLLSTEKAFVLEGWVSVPDKGRVEKTLAQFTCTYEYRQPSKDEEPPVKFKNNALIEPFEVITEMYGLPCPSSADPNPLIAPFFFLFFGMMLSDAGYGLLLIIAGFGVSRMLQSKDGMMYKLLRMLGICGISTVIWGAIYGGWFGDVVTQVAKMFGGDVTIPLLINPLEEPMTILVMSVAFGIVHIFVGMGVNAYLMIRRGRIWDAIFDVGFWYMVLGGLILMLVGMVLGSGSGAAFTIGMWVAIAGGVGLLCTGGREKPSLVGKLIGGLGSLYNITSYFSDILSYSRILALGLATGVIAMVVNILATMVAPPLGIILFIVIFLFGHALNLAINALGAYVHTSRLQYVEFFGKFYEGGGRPFVPFKAETKYHILQAKEEK